MAASAKPLIVAGGGIINADASDLLVEFAELTGVPEGLIYGFPVTVSGGKYSIVQGLEVSDFSRRMMDATAKELTEERDAVRELGLVK